jgi:hypothetical protein
MITNFTSDTYGGSTSIQQMPLGDNSTPGYTTNNQVTHINNEPRSDDRRNNGTSDRNDITPAVADDAAPVDNGKPVASPDIIDEGTMTEPKTNKLKTRVTAKSTDTERLKTIKEALKGEKVSTYQVSVMMDWFSFENSKLDFAKWAYDITMDKDHYSDLVAKFTYKDSEEDLRKFLQSK